MPSDCLLPCGCIIIPDFKTGDRIVTCTTHNQPAIVRARQIRTVEYTATPFWTIRYDEGKDDNGSDQE